MYGPTFQRSFFLPFSLAWRARLSRRNPWQLAVFEAMCAAVPSAGRCRLAAERDALGGQS
jgi:hypothetical protein